MTLRDLAYEALSFIAPSGSPTNQATLALASVRQKARLAADLTATMQEIYEQAPALYRRTLAATLPAARDVTVTVTDGSVNAALTGSFIEGATLLLGGVHNQIFTEDAQVRLLFPYAGPSGSVSARLYSDCVALDGTIAQVLDEVFLADGARLSPRTSRADLVGGVRDYPDYGRRVCVATSKPVTGPPRLYWVEDFLRIGGGQHAPQRRLRFMPLPEQQAQVSYDVRLTAPRYAAADLGDDDSDATVPLIVASDYHESLVRPLFLKRWSGSPWFRDDAARAALEEDATRARARLSEFHPQQKRNRRLTAPL